MTQYFFDIHDDEGIWPDEEGRELPDLEAAEVEAALSLASVAQSSIRSGRQYHLAVQARTADGPVFQAAFIFDPKLLQ